MVELGGERSGNIPDFGWEAAARSVKGARRRRRRGVGAGREIPPRAGSLDEHAPRGINPLPFGIPALSQRGIRSLPVALITDQRQTQTYS